MQNETPVTPEPQPDQETEQEYIERRKAYMDAYAEIEASSRLEDKLAQDEEDLRIMSTRLVIEVGKLIKDMGDELCQARLGRHDAFKADECRELLAWQFLSFVSTSSVERDEEFYRLCPRHYQYDFEHASYWFDTEQDADGNLTAIDFESDDNDQEAAE